VELAGRHRELAALHRLLERAAGGRGGLLVLIGPDGAGKGALLDAVCAEARARGFVVERQFDDTSREVLRLLAIEHVVDEDDEIARLSAMAADAATTHTAIVVATETSLGLGPELVVGPLDRDDFTSVVADLAPDEQEALFLATRGLPGLARRFATELAAPGDDDPFIHLALRLTSSAGFLEVDVALVGLLEAALERARDTATRARLMARLAYELLGDAGTGDRRRALADEALQLARDVGDDRTLAEVLDARLHALWDPAGADDRLAAASRIIELARASDDLERERRGLFWRFAALMELGRVTEAENALAAYARAGVAAADPESAFVVTARHAMLAALRGRFDEARRLTAEVAEIGTRLSAPDTGRLVGSLLASVAVQAGAAIDDDAPALLFTYARRQPGHLYEATAAVSLAVSGRTAEASAELERTLPVALRSSGPRWLSAMCELAIVAVLTNDSAAAEAIYAALEPYRNRLVVTGGANTALGPATRYLGMLALHLGALDDAVTYFGDAASMDEQVGALPGLANDLAFLAFTEERRARASDLEQAAADRRRAESLAERLGIRLFVERLMPSTLEWSLQRDEDDWLLVAGDERVRLRDGRGIQYLRALVAAPGHEIASLDLVAQGAGLVAVREEPVLDAVGRTRFQQRLTDLDAQLDAADRAGDQQRAAEIDAERTALVDELRRATGLGGRPRATSSETERARVNVTRTLRSTIERIGITAPIAAEHLRASLRTGRSCSYMPAPGGPARWRV